MPTDRDNELETLYRAAVEAAEATTNPRSATSKAKPGSSQPEAAPRTPPTEPRNASKRPSPAARASEVPSRATETAPRAPVPGAAFRTPDATSRTADLTLRPPVPSPAVPSPAASSPAPSAGLRSPDATSRAAEATPRSPATATRTSPETAPGPAAGPPKSAAPRRAGRGIELLPYGGEESLVDHKGRSRPLYQRKTAKPKVWRPTLPIRILLGLIPGLRVIILVSARRGAVYAGLGSLALIATIYLTTRWSSTTESLARVLVEQRWIILHASMIVLLVTAFELSRFGATLEENTKGPRSPRFLASLFLPALVVVFGAPQIVGVWARFVEAAWLGALTVVVGATPPAVWCLFGGADRQLDTQRPWRTGFIGLAFLVVLMIAAIAVPESREFLIEEARSHGFQLVPALLAWDFCGTKCLDEL